MDPEAEARTRLLANDEDRIEMLRTTREAEIAKVEVDASRLRAVLANG